MPIKSSNFTIVVQLTCFVHMSDMLNFFQYLVHIELVVLDRLLDQESWCFRVPPFSASTLLRNATQSRVAARKSRASATFHVRQVTYCHEPQSAHSCTFSVQMFFVIRRRCLFHTWSAQASASATETQLSSKNVHVSRVCIVLDGFATKLPVFGPCSQTVHASNFIPVTGVAFQHASLLNDTLLETPNSKADPSHVPSITKSSP